MFYKFLRSKYIEWDARIRMQRMLVLWLPFGQVVASMYSPKSLLSSPKKFLMSGIDCSSSVIWISPKKFTCPSGKLRTDFTSPIAKSTSPRPSDTTFFVRYMCVSSVVLENLFAVRKCQSQRCFFSCKSSLSSSSDLDREDVHKKQHTMTLLNLCKLNLSWQS